MRTKFTAGKWLLPVAMLLLAGCAPVGNHCAPQSVAYGVMAVISLALLVLYCCQSSRKGWMLVLFAAVAVVNSGYFALSISPTLPLALMSNRLAYLGSVVLPLAMLMIILEMGQLPCAKWVPRVLIGISVLVFLVTASQGILPLYYKKVTLIQINGATALEKEYGPLHTLYYLYLLGYFSAMVWAMLQIRKRNSPATHMVMLAAAAFVNMGVWLLEQVVKIGFEFLSVSYIVSELFLLGLEALLRETAQPAKPEPEPILPVDVQEHFARQLPTLTTAERRIYELYLEGKNTAQILELLNITENTLKYHNKNIYSKLGVSSRKELRQIAQSLMVQE